MKTETETTGVRSFYHVAGSGYEAGDALYCFDELEAMELAPEWKWEDEPFDTDVVCLFETLDEAQEMQSEHGGTILRVELPEDIYTVKVSEGYTAVPGRIESDFVKAIGG